MKLSQGLLTYSESERERESDVAFVGSKYPYELFTLSKFKQTNCFGRFCTHLTKRSLPLHVNKPLNAVTTIESVLNT